LIHTPNGDANTLALHLLARPHTQPAPNVHTRHTPIHSLPTFIRNRHAFPGPPRVPKPPRIRIRRKEIGCAHVILNAWVGAVRLQNRVRDPKALRGHVGAT
jgi:hypothetical protein